MANFISPFIAAIIAHGIITVPEPKIGSASTKPMPKCREKWICDIHTCKFKCI